jgi:apolipoprotein D and lipocalin family protein
VGIAALAAALACSALGCGSDAPLDVAPSVDLSRIQGKWYEIARLPRTTQADCHGTTAFYTQNPDGTLSLVNQCNVGGPTGPLDTVTMSATVPDGTNPAKLSLRVGGYTGDYWILEVGPNYEYAVVGHPSRLYLWILSRTSTLDADTLQGILGRAQGNRFDTTQMIYTPQPPAGERASSGTPVGSVPPAEKTGCSAAGGTANDAGAWTGGLIALGLAARMGRRRRRRDARRTASARSSRRPRPREKGSCTAS